MGIERAIDITDEERRIVLALLEQYLPGTAVWAYGSRVKWTSRLQSDLDLVVFSRPAQRDRVGALREAFDESNLSFRVDLFVWDEVPDRFRQQIQTEHVVVAPGFGGMTDENCQRMNGPTSPRCKSKLSEVAQLLMGQSPPGSTYNECGNGLPFFQGVKDFNYRHPTPRVFCSAPTRIAQSHDILFSVRAPIGRVNVADRECSIGRGLSIIRPRIPSDARYLEFALRNLESEWDVLESAGSVFGNATKRDLQNLPLPWPRDEYERSAIAHILGTLDDKIELNRRMNETLEAMARTLFKSWFVDFDPVRAKMEGHDTGLPKHIADLFPNRLIDSELGKIPEGWDVKPLAECTSLTMGQSPPGSTYNINGEGLPFFQGRSDFGFRYPSNRRFCTAPTRIAQSEDTLVSVRAPVGDINMAWDRCCIGRGVAALRHKSGAISFTYYSTWTIQAALREYEHTGTVFGAINKSQFEALRVIEPNRSVVDAFDSCARPLDARIKSNIRESRTLAALRDTLLAPMVSGEVRVGKSLGELHDIA